MNIMKNVSLKLHSTMRLGGLASYVVDAKSMDDLAEAEAWAEASQLPIRVIGSGSNIVWRDDGFKGLLVVNKIPGFEKASEDHLSATYTIGAGENWDSVVERTAKLGLSGIECLSWIPGKAGATPVQNVGAYGQDISQTLVSLTAYDRMEKSFVTLAAADCAFGYRTSRFKGVDNGRFLIAYITLKLQKNAPAVLWSKSIQDYLDRKEISKRDPMTIRKAVIAIRKAKLPDPEKIANCGSYFANPVIDAKQLKKLRTKHKDMPFWEMEDKQFKLAAAWLIEKAGFKGKRDPETGFSTWKDQALVLVNEKATSSNDLLVFQQKIIDTVQELFGIVLEPEPELLP